MRAKSFLILAATLAIFISQPENTTAANDPLYIKVRSTKLRTQPQQWSSPVATLNYGDKITSLSKNGPWHNVQFGNRKGFIHDSALSERKVVLQAAAARGTSENRDVVLAGKGFNKDVEKGYAAKNKNLNYPEVDRMESITVSDNELANFARAGKISGGN